MSLKTITLLHPSRHPSHPHHSLQLWHRRSCLDVDEEHDECEDHGQYGQHYGGHLRTALITHPKTLHIQDYKQQDLSASLTCPGGAFH